MTPSSVHFLEGDSLRDLASILPAHRSSAWGYRSRSSWRPWCCCSIGAGELASKWAVALVAVTSSPRRSDLAAPNAERSLLKSGQADLVPRTRSVWLAPCGCSRRDPSPTSATWTGAPASDRSRRASDRLGSSRDRCRACTQPFTSWLGGHSLLLACRSTRGSDAACLAWRCSREAP